MSTFFYHLLQRRSIFFYLLFLGYLAYVHPWLIERISVTDGGQIDRMLGWFLLALLCLELWGFWLKHPIMVYYARQYPAAGLDDKQFLQANASGCQFRLLVTIFVPILHMVMACFLYIAATQIGGLDPGGSAPAWQQLLYVGGFFIVLIKETGMIGLFYSPFGLRGPSNDTYPTLGWHGLTNGEYPSEIRLEHLLRDTLGDFILLVFSAVAYAVLWDTVTLISPIRDGSFFEYLGLGVYFLMAILPLQSIYLFQAVTIRQTRTHRIWMVVSFLILVIVAILSFSRV